ncbi:MAG TPA: PilZ domain-containing protein [Pyrinomonadaceae bacterium]|jgi:c-di-GMP-binding flagellar brake protein YcgR
MLHPSWQPRGFQEERRASPRRAASLEARLLFSLTTRAEIKEDRSEAPQLTLKGRTRNLSETGLALEVPSIRLGRQYLNVVGSDLSINLELPSGPVGIKATPVRCERIKKETEQSYLLGVRIIEMSDGEWVRLVQYVRSLD